MMILRELAPAKINLYLHVVGKREDGYHLLDSLVAFTDAGDKLEVVPSDALTLALEGPYAASLDADDNSIMRAARALQAHAGITAGAALTLHKYLPVASGIGGGSADAAAALRLLARFWRITASPGDMKAIALSLGADVPACLRSESLYMSGIGEEIEPGPKLSRLPLVLANPGKPLATAEVFKRFKGSFSGPPRHPGAFATQQACTDFLRKARNDLQETARALVPEIGTVLEALEAQEGCQLARMSGSGATCFGIFTQDEAARKAVERLTARHPGWWVRATHAR